jgi:hypothetical protein
MAGSWTACGRIRAQYEDFVIFFVSLQRERRDYVMQTYGAQIKQSVERVAGVAHLAIDFTADESIETAVKRLLALSVLDLSTNTSGSRDLGVGKIVEATL